MNKKGFTLIEIIAVIVLIGVLLLIASTAVINHMNSIKKSAALENGKSYVTAINDYNFISEGVNPITSANVTVITPRLKDSYTGTKPDSGTITVDATTNKVTSAELHFNNYVVNYNGTKFTVSRQ